MYCPWREVFVQRFYGNVSPWPPVPTVLKHYTKTNILFLSPPVSPLIRVYLYFSSCSCTCSFNVYLHKVYVAISVITENLGRCRCLLKMSQWQFVNPSHILIYSTATSIKVREDTVAVSVYLYLGQFNKKSLQVKTCMCYRCTNIHMHMWVQCPKVIKENYSFGKKNM